MSDRITRPDLEELQEQLNALTSVKYVIHYTSDMCGLYAYLSDGVSIRAVCAYQTKYGLYTWLKAYIAGIEEGLAEAKRQQTQQETKQEPSPLDTSNIAYSPAVWDADQQKWLYGQEADNYRDTHPVRYGD